MEKVAQLSQNPQAVKNREAVLVLLKQQYAALSATMHVQAPVASASPVVCEQAPLDVAARKRQMDREDALFELEMAERKQRLMQLTVETQTKTAEAQAKVVDVQKMLMDTYTSLCPNQVIDDRARLMFKDNILNIAVQSNPASTQLAIGNGGATTDKPITISNVANSKGRHFSNPELQKIGKKMAAAYREKYGKNPEKHEQYVDQAVRYVNSYTERDLGMLEAVIADYVAEQQ